MAVPARHPLMTAEQLFDLPDDGYRSELVEGEIVRMAPAGGTHGIVAMRTGVLLSEYVDEHRLGVCFAAETGFILQRDPDTVRAPDVAFVAADRVPNTGVPTFYWPSAPDLAIEVLSPWDRPAEVRRKVDEYFAAGARLVWIVDPASHTVHVYRSPHDVHVLQEDDEWSGDDVLRGFRWPVRRLFCGSGPPPADAMTCDRKKPENTATIPVAPDE